MNHCNITYDRYYPCKFMCQVKVIFTVYVTKIYEVRVNKPISGTSRDKRDIKIYAKILQ